MSKRALCHVPNLIRRLTIGPMLKALWRWRKFLASALLLLDVTGARVIAVTSDGDTRQVYFTPDLACKALLSSVAHRDWSRSGRSALGDQARRYQAQDLEKLDGCKRVVLAALPTGGVAIDSQRPRTGPSFSWKLPLNSTAVQPTHLRSKK